MEDITVNFTGADNVAAGGPNFVSHVLHTIRCRNFALASHEIEMLCNVIEEQTDTIYKLREFTKLVCDHLEKTDEEFYDAHIAECDLYLEN